MDEPKVISIPVPVRPPFSKVAAAYYLAALIDGEGHVSKPNERNSKRVIIVNTDMGILRAVILCCRVLGIANTGVARRAKSKTNRIPVFHIRIYGRENLLKVAKLPLQSKAKRDRLQEHVQSYGPDPVPLQKLKDLRAAGLSTSEIAKKVGYLNRSTVSQRLNRKRVAHG